MPKPRPYPIFLALAGRPVLIVGGGAVGARKAKGLLEAGAHVTIVSPAFDGEFSRLKAIRKIRWKYASAHMHRDNWRLVFAATGVEAVNQRVQKDAAAAGILCCRCDVPDESDFANAATANVGDVLLAVSTGGASPSLSTRLRNDAVKAIDPLLAELATLHKGWRTRIKKTITDIALRRILLQRLANEEMVDQLRRHGRAGANRLLKKWLNEFAEPGLGTPARGRHA